MTRLFLLSLVAMAPAFAPPWMKLDEALAAAASSDKLVAVYATIPAEGDREDHGSPDADAALASKAVAARYSEFFWVKAADKATAKRIDAPGNGTNLVFLDPDGGLVGVWNVQVGGEKKMLQALDEAKAQYLPAPVPWFDGEPDENSESVKRKLIVYCFLDDKEPSEKSIKALEHPWVAREHARAVFVRKYVLDSPLAKRFKVTSAPTFVFCDPGMKDGQEIVERRTGELTPKIVRAALKKHLDRVKKSSRREVINRVMLKSAV